MKWNEFESNIRESFEYLRDEQRLFDVTLATDDGHLIQAHKIILSAGSKFFSDIFKKSDHSNLLIYLKGIKSAELKHVTDFLYRGEAYIDQDGIKQFLETAHELKVKGLQVDTPIFENSLLEDKKPSNENDFKDSENKFDDTANIVEDEPVATESMEIPSVKQEETDSSTNKNSEIELQIEHIIEKKNGLWECKVCGRTSHQKRIVKIHAETHIQGESHVCHVCSKIFATRHNLRMHISNNHSELFSCDICGKSGMNRLAFKNHKRRSHKVISEHNG